MVATTAQKKPHMRAHSRATVRGNGLAERLARTRAARAKLVALVALCAAIVILPLAIADAAHAGSASFANGSDAEASGSAVTMRVGYFASPGFQEQEDDGSFSGYGCDYLQELGRVSGIDFEYGPGTREECLERLRTGEIDMLGLMPRSEPYTSQFAYPAWNIGYDTVHLFARADDGGAGGRTWSDFAGAKIGLVAGFSLEDQLSSFASSQGLTYDIVPYASDYEAQEALQRGEIDLWCWNNREERASSLRSTHSRSATPLLEVTRRS